MKKIPTLFEREYENHKVVAIHDKVTDGMEWVLRGEGTATVKWDGSCCAIIDGELYKRYDAKKGKQPPAGAIPCCEPDEITGHWPHWVKCNKEDPADRWFFEAFHFSSGSLVAGCEDGTYEAVGPHFNGNNHCLDHDELIAHGQHEITSVYPLTSFENIKRFLEKHYIEGIVFWKDGEPKCKIKRSDFGFEWGE